MNLSHFASYYDYEPNSSNLAAKEINRSTLYNGRRSRT